jgi:hypothetical protein
MDRIWRDTSCQSFKQQQQEVDALSHTTTGEVVALNQKTTTGEVVALNHKTM